MDGSGGGRSAFIRKGNGRGKIREEERKGSGAGAAPARSVGRGRSNGGYGGRGRGKRWVVKSKCAAEIGAIEPTDDGDGKREKGRTRSKGRGGCSPFSMKGLTF